MTVAACGRARSTGSGAGRPRRRQPSEPPPGTITVWAMGAEGEKLPELAKEFEAANPAPRSTSPRSRGTAAHDKFTTAITAGETPDVAMVGTTWMGEFADLDALDPTPASIDTRRVLRGRQVDHRGGRHGLRRPVVRRDPAGLLPHRPGRAGRLRASAPPTGTGLKQMASAMQTKAGAKWGIGLQAGGAGSWQYVMPFAWSNGAELAKTTATPTTSTPRRWSRRWSTTRATSPTASPTRPRRRPDHRGRLRQRQGADVHLRPVDDVGGREASVARASRTSTTSRRSRPEGGSLVVRRRLEPRRCSRTARTATASGSSSSGCRARGPGRSGTGCPPTCPSVSAAWDDPALSVDEKLADVRRAARDRQGAAVVPDLGAGRHRLRHRDGEGHQDRRRPGRGAEDRPEPGRLDRHRAVRRHVPATDGPAAVPPPSARPLPAGREGRAALDAGPAVLPAVPRLHASWPVIQSVYMSFTDTTGATCARRSRSTSIGSTTSPGRCRRR